jgi:hypothetical protein
MDTNPTRLEQPSPYLALRVRLVFAPTCPANFGCQFFGGAISRPRHAKSLAKK